MNQPSSATLEQFQKWMQTVVTHPQGVISGCESPEARAQIVLDERDLENVVCRSQALTAVERLEIYNRAYFGRLLECLREEYPVLAKALGIELFDSFALAYLHAHPPTSYTLANLGDKFPEHLAATRPAATDLGNADAGWPEFLIDLARLERTVSEVFDGPGPEGQPLLSAEHMRTISPDRWPHARLVCVTGLRLVQFAYPVNDYFTAIKRGADAPLPERRPSFVAVARRDYRVHRYPLVAAQHALLSALVAGEPVGAAVTRAGAISSLPDDQFAAELGWWFNDWTRAGLFLSATEAPPSPPDARGGQSPNAPSKLVG